MAVEDDLNKQIIGLNFIGSEYNLKLLFLINILIDEYVLVFEFSLISTLNFLWRLEEIIELIIVFDSLMLDVKAITIYFLSINKFPKLLLSLMKDPLTTFVLVKALEIRL